MNERLLEIDVPGAALESSSLVVAAGEVVALLGANGSGKSTLLRSIMGLYPARGAVRLAGEEIGALSPAQRARRGIGYVPEGRRLFPGMNVRDTLLVGAHGSAAAAGPRLRTVLELFPMLEKRLETPAWQLSGGQQQMLAIGRALMSEPRLLLLDEPSLGLAPVVVDELMLRLRGIAAQGTAVLLAEQSVARTLEIADRVYALAMGRVVAEGTPAAVHASGVLERAFLGADVVTPIRNSSRAEEQP